MGEDIAFLLMSGAEATRLRIATAMAKDRLEPRRIGGGPHAGRHALPRRVTADAAFAVHRAAFAAMDEAALDPAEAWPLG